MRLADRVFAFWRLPAWTDAVQVLLWLMGWMLVFLFAALLAFLGPVWLRGLHPGPGGEPLLSALIPVILLFLAVGWFVMASWFISEAYGGWRAGHPHGKGWAILIGAILVTNAASPILIGFPVEGVQRVAYSLGAAFGLALLVAVVTTKPPPRRDLA